MYDYGLSTLEQYGLTAESTARTRGGLLCHTEKGLVIVKEFKGTEKKLQKQQELLLQIQSQGGKVDCYIPNQEENLVSRDRDGIPYTMQHWYEGYSDKDREFILHYHCQAVMGLLREWTKQDTENIGYIVHQIYLLLMGKAVLVSDENNDL